MRLLIIICALAYWGLATFAQDLFTGGAVEFTGELAAAEPAYAAHVMFQAIPEPGCDEKPANDLFVSVGYSDLQAPEKAAQRSGCPR